MAAQQQQLPHLASLALSASGQQPTLAELERDLQLSASLGQQLLDDKQALERRLEQAENGNAKLVERLASGIKENARLTRQLETALASLDQADSSNRALLSSLSDSRKTISRLSSDSAKLLSTSTSLRNLQRAHDDALQELKAERKRADLAEGKVRKMSEKLGAVEERRKKAIDDLEEMRQDKVLRSRRSTDALTSLKSRLASREPSEEPATEQETQELLKLVETLVNENDLLRSESVELKELLNGAREEQALVAEELSERVRELSTPQEVDELLEAGRQMDPDRDRDEEDDDRQGQETLKRARASQPSSNKTLLSEIMSSPRSATASRSFSSFEDAAGNGPTSSSRVASPTLHHPAGANGFTRGAASRDLAGEMSRSFSAGSNEMGARPTHGRRTSSIRSSGGGGVGAGNTSIEYDDSIPEDMPSRPSSSVGGSYTPVLSQGQSGHTRRSSMLSISSTGSQGTALDAGPIPVGSRRVPPVAMGHGHGHGRRAMSVDVNSLPTGLGLGLAGSSAAAGGSRPGMPARAGTDILAQQSAPVSPQPDGGAGSFARPQSQQQQGRRHHRPLSLSLGPSLFPHPKEEDRRSPRLRSPSPIPSPSGKLETVPPSPAVSGGGGHNKKLSGISLTSPERLKKEREQNKVEMGTQTSPRLEEDGGYFAVTPHEQRSVVHTPDHHAAVRSRDSSSQRQRQKIQHGFAVSLGSASDLSLSQSERERTQTTSGTDYSFAPRGAGGALAAATTQQQGLGFSPSQYSPATTFPSALSGEVKASPSSSLSHLAVGTEHRTGALRSLVDVTGRLLGRLQAADLGSMERRLKKQNLAGDVGFMAQANLRDLVNDIEGLRGQFKRVMEGERAVLEAQLSKGNAGTTSNGNGEGDHPEQSLVLRRDFIVLVKLARDLLVEISRLRALLNRAQLDPTPLNLSEIKALDVPNQIEIGSAQKTSAAGFTAGGFLAPISRLLSTASTFTSSDAETGKSGERAGSGSPGANARAKTTQASAVTAASVNVEFGKGVVRRAVADDSSDPNASSFSLAGGSGQGRGSYGRKTGTQVRRDLNNIFAGGLPAAATSSRPALDTSRPLSSFNPLGRLLASYKPATNSTTNAVLDSLPQSRATGSDERPTLLERQLRPRGLSDSSIRSTFVAHANPYARVISPATLAISSEGAGNEVEVIIGTPATGDADLLRKSLLQVGSGQVGRRPSNANLRPQGSRSTLRSSTSGSDARDISPHSTAATTEPISISPSGATHGGNSGEAGGASVAQSFAAGMLAWASKGAARSPLAMAVASEEEDVAARVRGNGE